MKAVLGSLSVESKEAHRGFVYISMGFPLCNTAVMRPRPLYSRVSMIFGMIAGTHMSRVFLGPSVDSSL